MRADNQAQPSNMARPIPASVALMDKDGDVIKIFNGVEVKDFEQLRDCIEKLEPGEKVIVTTQGLTFEDQVGGPLLHWTSRPWHVSQPTPFLMWMLWLK